MKILIATEIYWPHHDGGSIFERNLALGLAELGHDVHVVTPSYDGPAVVEQDGATTVHRMKSRRLPGRFGKGGARLGVGVKGYVETLVTELQPEIIHSHNPFQVGRASLKSAKKHRIPFVATNHNMPENTIGNVGLVGKLVPDLYGRIWKWQIKYLNQANYVTSPTKTAVDMLLAHGLTAPARPVSNGVDLELYNTSISGKELRKKYHLPKKPVVLYMGRLDGEKRMDVWIEAAALLRKEFDAHFLIGGKGTELEALKRRSVALGIGEHVTFAGRVEDEDLAAFYHTADAFMITSPAELQSLVTLEAMASGLPVVACDAGALPELCISGRNGYLFLNGDPKGAAKALERILRNPTMAGKMGAESRKIVEQSHSLKDMPPNYVSVYEEVVR